MKNGLWAQVSRSMLEVGLIGMVAIVSSAMNHGAKAGAAGKAETKDASATTAAEAPSQTMTCEQTVSANDMMKFDTKELIIDQGCAKFKLTLKHTGRLPKAAMGHNIVLAEDSKVDAVVAAGIKAGVAKGYVPDSPDVLGATSLIGGGESATVEIDVVKLKNKSISFFCLFPGHTSMMRGKVTVQPAAAKAAS